MSIQSKEVTLHDGSKLDIQIYGEGPTILLPVNPTPIEAEQAEALRQYGGDPALGKTLIDGLSDAFRVVAFDYEGHVLSQPMPDTLTPDNFAADMLAIADAAGADSFAYYGYSWLAMVGFQLALRTNRLSALMMGGYPPIDGPFAEMMKVVTAANDASGGDPNAPLEDEWSTARMSKGQTQQFVTLYAALQGFDDRAALPKITCPRLCFAGSGDEIEYADPWGGVLVSISGPMIRQRAELEALGWDVYVLDGLDHMGAMHATRVLSIIRPWLESKLIAAQ